MNDDDSFFSDPDAPVIVAMWVIYLGTAAYFIVERFL